MRECIDTWLKDEVIERASPNSDWNSPLTLAPKKDLLGNLTGHRPCLDPRLLNSILVSNDRHPIPKIEEIFDRLQGSTIFTTLLSMISSYFPSLMRNTSHMCKT
ncbi:hypothetical protein G6F62_014755 [Rhizopus arrhizus]|nr:hypothetical protein G6F23_014128 [Rhizopus arrhizus]KAG0740779.1 hypothetical protein G6F24_016907 [Rhizopus arrhizus]KAG0849347.1 hypothetical protein G6F15_014207 [Rhizopus arrhizus]KAG0856096.1 hypothetical protein G6F16_013592 [Rhizopus arrhizus]KAG0921079.1 hypothetical protein G6F30_014272 [Rhizopus arrhizus]